MPTYDEEGVVYSIDYVDCDGDNGMFRYLCPNCQELMKKIDAILGAGEQ